MIKLLIQGPVCGIASEEGKESWWDSNVKRPWVARIDIFGKTKKFSCSGSLLSQRWVLTSKSCICLDNDSSGLNCTKDNWNVKEIRVVFLTAIDTHVEEKGV